MSTYKLPDLNQFYRDAAPVVLKRDERTFTAGKLEATGYFSRVSEDKNGHPVYEFSFRAHAPDAPSIQMWVNMSYFSAWEALTEKGEINPSGPLGGAQLMQAAGIDPALWQTNGELDYAKIEKNFGKGGKMISVTLQGAPGDKNAAKRWQQYDRFTPISPTARLHPARITPVASSYTPGQDAGGVVGDDDIPF